MAQTAGPHKIKSMNNLKGFLTSSNVLKKKMMPTKHQMINAAAKGMELLGKGFKEVVKGHKEHNRSRE